jgi:hypothetical protein
VELDGLRFVTPSSAQPVATIRSGNEDLIAERFVFAGENRMAIIGSSTSDISNKEYNMLLQFVEQELESERFDFGETGDQRGFSIIRAEDGGLVFVGKNSFENNSLITLVKTRSNGQL